MYSPQPINTENIVLTEVLKALTENIAENAHENWAAGRIKEGWTYGPLRDDELKYHPCLVPYSELPESEKEYERVTAMEMLKVIQTLGFEITDRYYYPADWDDKIRCF